MAEVIGVRFKNMGKVYYFDPEEYELKIGDNVIVETARGVECGEVAMERKEIAEEDIVQPLKKLIRIATPDELEKGRGKCDQREDRVRDLREKDRGA